jgi:vacuolar protein sorting-associated protein 54
LDGIQGLWDEWERMQERQRRKLAKGKGKEKDGLMQDDLNENDDGDQKKEAIVLPDLAGIPDLFFDPGFDLANPLTWERVMAGPNPAAGSSTAHGPPSPEVQESLSSNLDDLESHLVHEISLRTPSFFSALSNLQSLNAQTTSCLDRISALRRELAELDEKQAIKGLRVVDRQERLRKCKEMKSAVTEVEGLRAAGRLAKELGEAGDWVGALEGMEAVGRWWRRYSDVDSPSGEKTTPPVLPLATLSSLASIPNDLSILSRQIAIQLEAALSSLVISIIGTSPGSRAGSVAPSRSSSPSRQPHPPNDVGRAEAQYNEARIEFRHQSQPILIGLARCDSRDSALKVWRTCVSRVVKEGMRQHLQIDHEGEEDGHNVDEHKG